MRVLTPASQERSQHCLKGAVQAGVTSFNAADVNVK